MANKLLSHESIRRYFDDDNTECSDYAEKIAKALEGTKLLISSAYHALRNGLDKSCAMPSFERYFGKHTPEKEAKVIKVDVTIRIGTKHLSARTSVYLPQSNTWAPCHIDLSCKDAFDSGGRYNIASQALFPLDSFFYGGHGSSVLSNDTPRPFTFNASKSKHASGVEAFVPGHDDRLKFEGGKDIFISPSVMKWDHLLAPFESDHVIQAYDKLCDVFNKLPGTLLHELCHTVLLGGREERLVDEKVIPFLAAPRFDMGGMDRIKLIPTFKNPGCRIDLPTTMYGPDFCHFVAKSDRDDQVRKCLTNADSYKWFATSVYLRKLKWDFRDGWARSVNPKLTDGKTITQLTYQHGVIIGDNATDDEEQF